MAERASNSRFLEVLPAAELQGVGWFARVLSQRDYATTVGEAARFIKLSFTRAANEPGGGSVTLPVDAPLFTQPQPLGESVPVLEQQALWQIIENGVVRHEFLAEDYVEDVVVDRDGTRATVVNGRGTACVLEWARVLPEGMPNPTSTEREFNAPPMAVWRQLFLEAQAQGYLEWVRLGFSATEDSAGQPWGAAQAVSVNAGEDLLTLLTRWCEANEYAWEMLPGFRLQVFAEAGNHREAEVVFPIHRGQSSHRKSVTRRELANVVYADSGDDGIAVAQSTSSQAVWRKRALWVSAGDSSDATGRSAVANATLGERAQPRTARTVQVPIDMPGRRPFVDFNVHDWITLELEGGAADAGAARVVAIALAVEESGKATGELSLQSKTEARAVRTQRLLERMGASSTADGAASPIPVSKLVAQTRVVDLADVDAAGIQAGDVLVWDGAKFVDEVPRLELLADVDAANPDEGDVLTFDQAAGLARWLAPAAPTVAQVEGLQEQLDGKAPTVHTQPASSITGQFTTAQFTHRDTTSVIDDASMSANPLGAIGEPWYVTGVDCFAFVYTSAGPGNAIRAITATGAGTERMVSNRLEFAAQAGEQWSLRARVQNQSNAAVEVQVVWLLAGGGTAVVTGISVPAGTSWTNYEEAKTAPADALRGYFRILIPAAATSGSVWVTRPKLLRVVDAPQLGNGAVTLPKLSSAGAAVGQVPTFDGSAVVWQTPPSGGGGGGSAAGALLHLAVAPAAAGNTRVILLDTTERLDGGFSYNPATGELTCTVAGWYSIAGAVTISALVVGQHVATILRNGVQTLTGENANASRARFTVAGVDYLAAGDKLQLQLVAPATSTTLATGRGSTYLRAVRLG